MNNYYIIGKDFSGSGLFALYIWIVGYIIDAKNRGYIPVVDLKNNNNILFKDGRTYKDNTWEYFFKQPEDIGLEDIPKDAKVILAEKGTPNVSHVWPNSLPLSKEEKRNIPNIDSYIKYLKFNDETQEYLEKGYKKVTKENTNILGVLCRGSDYNNIKPDQHAIQPTAEEVIKKCIELKAQYNYDYIYLATEDAKIYEQFKRKFKNILLSNNQYRFKKTKNKRLNYINVKEENHFYNLNLNYLLSMYILSKCKHFIGGRTAGTVAVYLLSNEFENQEYVYLWDKGLYNNKKSKNKFLQQIFSVKNTNDKKRKIITILGIKFKIKRSLHE